jgi:hypothetical protein
MGGNNKFNIYSLLIESKYIFFKYFPFSSWTGGHISTLWGCQPHIVYPPCNVETLAALDNQSEQKFMMKGKPDAIILSVGQIRPEKNHLEVFL